VIVGDGNDNGTVGGNAENPVVIDTKEPEKPADKPKDPGKPVVVVKPEEPKKEEPKEPEKPATKPEEKPAEIAKLCFFNTISDGKLLITLYFSSGKMPGYAYVQVDYPTDIVQANRIDWYWNKVAFSEKTVGSLIFEVENTDGSQKICQMTFKIAKVGKGKIFINPATAFYESQTAFRDRLDPIKGIKPIPVPFPSPVEVDVK